MTTEPERAPAGPASPASPAAAGLIARSSSGGGTPLGSSGGSGRGGSGGGYGGAPPPGSSGRAGPGGPNRPGGPPGPERSVSYQPEERYWTDYLRIAFPAIGLVLLLGLFWFWANELIGDDDNGNNVTGQVTNTPTPTQSTGGDQTAETPVGSTGGEPTPRLTEGNGAQPTRTPRSVEPTETTAPAVGDYNEGDIVVTNGEANLRSEPALDDGNIITQIPEGTEMTVTGASVEADGYIWTPVEDADGNAGYIAQDLLDAT